MGMFSAAMLIRCNRRQASEGNCRGYRASRYLTRVKRLVEFRESTRSDDLSVICGKEQGLLGRHAEDNSDAVRIGILCSRFSSARSKALAPRPNQRSTILAKYGCQ